MTKDNGSKSVKNEWWNKIPKKAEITDLQYYQTEKKIISIQLMALSPLEIADCYNFCVFENKLPLSNIASKVKRKEMVETLTSSKIYLELSKFWLNKVRITNR